MMLGNGVYALCQWGVLIVLTKLGSTAEVGVFALALAITAPVMMIANMQLRGVQATDARREYSLSDYVAVRLLTALTAFMIVLAIAVFGGFESTTLWVIVLVGIAKAIESLSDVLYGYFQQQEKMQYIAVSMVTRGALSVLVLGVIFYLSQQLSLSLVGMCVAWMCVLLAYDVVVARKLLLVEGGKRGSLVSFATEPFIRRRTYLLRILKIAFPLGIVMGMISLNTNIPRYIIEVFLGTEALGIFAALAYTVVAINMFTQALGQAVSPRLAKHFADGNIRTFVQLLLRVIMVNGGIGLAGVVLLSFVGPEILAFLYTPEYATHATLFLVLMATAALMGIASAFGYAMTAARLFRPQVPLFMAVLMSTTLSSYVFIPRLHLYGAVIALTLSCLVQILSSFVILQRSIRTIHGGGKRI